MMKLTPKQLRMVMVLAVVAVLCALFLGVTNMVTRAPIEQAERQALLNALQQVLPEHANDPLQDTRTLQLEGQPKATTFYLSRNVNRDINAVAWETIAPDGYSGRISILMAVRADGSIQAIRITKHHETPGLGDGVVKNQQWVDAFSHKSLTNARWGVKKDGGDFDQFTGATITPRAVVKAVNRGLEVFEKHRDLLLAPVKKGEQKVTEDAHG